LRLASQENFVARPDIFDRYWNKPEETERAFHDGWFRTGDVAVRDEHDWSSWWIARKHDRGVRLQGLAS